MDFIIKEYINKLTEEEIKTFLNKKGINPNNEEIKVLYLYAKNYYQVFYKGNPTELLIELKEKLTPTTYNSLLLLYKEYQNKRF